VVILFKSVLLEPEEYEVLQKASVIALEIPWDLNSSRVRNLDKF
jgi:hypothetical protein